MGILKNLKSLMSTGKTQYELACEQVIIDTQLERDNLKTENEKLFAEVTGLNTQVLYLLKQSKPVEAKSYGRVSYNNAMGILKKALNPSQVYLSDLNFDVTTVAEAKRFSKETLVNTKKYASESHDCENFSWALLGYWSEGLKSFAFGFAWSNSHSFNIMIDSDGKVWIIEPQTNEYIPVEKAKKLKQFFPIRLIVM